LIGSLTSAQCLNLCLLSAILLGIIYLFFGAFALVFGNNHHFQQWQLGLTFLGIFVGMITGISTSYFWDKLYQKQVQREETRTGTKGASEPEFRLPPTIAGAVLVPVGLFGKLLRATAMPFEPLYDTHGVEHACMCLRGVQERS